MRAWLILGSAVMAVSAACSDHDDDIAGNEPSTTLAGEGHQSPTADDAPPADQGPPPVLGPLVRVCPMGDSITAGTGEHASYRRPLWQSLKALGANVDFVGSMDDNNTGPPPFDDYDWDNEGHGGYTADELAGRLEAWILEYEVPDIVLLHIGTNDLLRDDTTASVLADIDRLLAIIRGRNPNAIIVLAQIIGMTTQSFTDKARMLNAAMPAFVASRTTTASPLYLVDQMAGFAPATMTYDGTHPNEEGEAVIADVWLTRLRPLLGLE